ncbi:MAG: YbdD/YjiX family protein, partial [Gemmatimonadota bacterium]
SVVARSVVARSVVAQLAAQLRRVFGMPDYTRYLEHQHRCHPETPALSEKDFVKGELERKYAGGVGRCC